jgi:hypothetical protein
VWLTPCGRAHVLNLDQAIANEGYLTFVLRFRDETFESGYFRAPIASSDRYFFFLNSFFR